MFERFMRLLKEKGKRFSDISKETGIPYSTFTDWKAGRYTPKADKLQKIADYFHVTMEYLMTGKDFMTVTTEWGASDEPPTTVEIKRIKAEWEDATPETAPSLSPMALEIARAFDQAAEYQQLAVCQLLGVDYKKGIESSRDVG